MSMWDKLQKELDRAGDAARGALDEGKLRIELFRVRQMADKAAEALGYAVHRARREGKELEPEVLERLDAALSKHDDEAIRIETELAKPAAGTAEETADATGTSAAAGSDPAAAPAAPAARAAGDSSQ